MYSMMKNGAKIEIKPFAKGTESFVASIFWMKNGSIWCSNPVFGTFEREEMTEESFTEHVVNMIREGFQVVAHG